MRWPERYVWQMRLLAAATAPLLATLLLIAAVVAPAHCLRGAAHAAEAPALCLPGVVFAEAASEEQAPAAPHQGGICVVCLGLANALPAAPPVALPPPADAGPVRFAAPAPLAAAAGPPYASTGPPQPV
jgi:hypothetical protein